MAAKTWKTGDVITSADMNRIESGLEVPGPKGDKGKDGLSIKAIALTKDESGLITGGTATLTDDSTIAITVK